MGIAVPDEKLTLRHAMRQRLKARPGEAYRDASHRICRHLDRLKLDRQGPGLLVFNPLTGEEPDLGPWLSRRLSANRSLLLPRIEDAELTPCRVETFESLVRSPFGTFDPPPGAPPFPLEEIEMVLLPGLAFQLPFGRRLGRGGGHYDRLVARLPAECVLIGVCFDDQLVRSLPVEAHDRPVHYVLTEDGLHYAGMRSHI